MWDLNNPGDVIDAMRDGEMTDEQIIRVCEGVIAGIREEQDEEGDE